MGHEQRGTRPCVVVSDPRVAETQRFPLVRSIDKPGVIRLLGQVTDDELRSIDEGLTLYLGLHTP